MRISIFENETRKSFDADARAGLFRGCVGVATSEDISEKIATGPHGKPYFAEPPLQDTHFSVSHSGRYWAALFADSEVGLDIEDLSIRHRLTEEKMGKIAARFFSPDECGYIDSGAVDAPWCVDSGAPTRTGANETASDLARTLAGYSDRTIRFFRVWTAKESYIKYTGNGMSEGLASFSVFHPPCGVTITTISPAPDLICSFCLVGTGIQEIVFVNNDREGK